MAVFTVGVGDTSAPEDVRIKNVEYNSIVRAPSKTNIDATLQYTGPGAKRVTLKLTEDGRTIFARDTTITEDLGEVVIEVSLLSAPERMECETEADLLEQLRPGIDGLILEFGPHRATFLPSVWRHLPEPGAFLHQLKLKGGFSSDFWSPEITVWRYTVESWQEGSE